MSDESKEDRIRRRAYEIWEREGRKHGEHDSHWHKAAAEEEAAEPPLEAPGWKPDVASVITEAGEDAPTAPRLAGAPDQADLPASVIQPTGTARKAPAKPRKR